ncbi:hypothetical protein SAMN05443252_105156 [Bacillus sp. OV322]|nr:hypothetical protein SAMN05443252_105156 [Bacillus sp. OV322]
MTNEKLFILESTLNNNVIKVLNGINNLSGRTQ